MASDKEIIKDLADHMHSLGWSRPKANMQAEGWFEFLAPRIRAQGNEQAEPVSGCPNCDGEALYDLLGHDSTGHRVGNALITKGVMTPEDLKSRSLAWIIDWTRVGTKGIDRIRARVGEDTYQAMIARN